ncbi:MAG: cytochrome c3 family protein [Fidelibacterota bacterium]
MKKLLTVIAVCTTMTGLVLSQGISGSDHDFNWATEVCQPCHTPHNASAEPNAPLWNHELTVATFDPYASSFLDATVGQPAGVSKLCLSCHDGTVAADNYGGTTNGNQFLSGGEMLGTNLTDDHPISFTYDAALATTDGGLHDPTQVNSGLGGTIAQDMLENNTMQCSSCHDVHDEAGNSKLLVINNNNSALCLTCHDK